MLRNKWLLMMALLLVVVLAACGTNDAEDTEGVDDDEEIPMLGVEFDVPETAEVDEAVELEASVTFGDDPVVDADEVVFEIWEMCDKDNSISEEPTNNEDGTYTFEHTFTEDGVYEMYAHTTAHAQHTMPLKEITVGEGGDYDCEDEEDDHDMMDHDEHEDHEEAEEE